MICVLNNFGPCLAKKPEACECRRMKKNEYIEIAHELAGGKPKPAEHEHA